MNAQKRKARAKNKAKQATIQRQDRRNSRAFAKHKQGKVDEAVDKYMQGR